MPMAQPDPKLCQSLTPELQSLMVKRTDSLLVKIVRANFNTQYASKAASLAEFRYAIAAQSSAPDKVLIQDFRYRVPLSDYESYKPFMTVFDNYPCKEADLENLFAPGLPSFLLLSSSTSGRGPKVFPKYRLSVPTALSDSPGLTAVVIFYGFREVKEVEREPGQIVKRILVSIGSSALARAMQGWTNIEDDDSRMSLILPGFVAPWAASMISHYKSFLIIHALFALASRDLDRILIPFSTQFYDMMRYMNEEWDIFLSSIRDGIIPDLPGMGEVRSYLQAHLHPNSERAAELGEIGPPFSCEEWASHVWPKLSLITTICNGPFATVLPKIKSVTGPTITIRTPGYGSSESYIAVPYRQDNLHALVLQCDDLVEFLDVASEESHENLHQAWELEVGKRYEVVVTTSDGLWRYRLGDVIEILGFDADTGSPVFAICGRRTLAIRFPGMLVTDAHLIPAIQAVGSDVMQVNEFTTLLDNRKSTQTVGFFVELAEALGPNAHLAPSRLAKGLADTNIEFQEMLKKAEVRHPTVRIVRPGTFSEYRQWRAERMNIGHAQIKVPVILPDEDSIQWILEHVVREL